MLMYNLTKGDLGAVALKVIHLNVSLWCGPWEKAEVSGDIKHARVVLAADK